MPKQLSGTLANFRLTQLLHLISLAKRTGTLHIYEPVQTGKQITTEDGLTTRPEVIAGEECATVAFRAGKLIYAAMSRQDDHLATILHKAGKLNDEQHRIIREKSPEATDKTLGLRLMNANYVTQNDILESIQQYTLEITYDLMTWNEEPFVFEEDVQPPSERITVSIDLEDIIIEGANRSRELDI